MLFLTLLIGGGATSLLFASCGPFTDVGTLICPFVLELYYSGITAGTSATTYSPNDPVTRGQMAVFTSTALDLSLARSSRRAALGQWWTTTPHFDAGLGITSLASGSEARLLAGDGTDIWAADFIFGTVTRIHASDGAILGTWTGATDAQGVLAVMGRVFVTGTTNSGSLYMLDPTQPPGPVTTISNNLGADSGGIAFDGTSIWTANNSGHSVAKITPANTPGSWIVSTFTSGFVAPSGPIFDGNSIWVTDSALNAILKLNPDGSVAQSVPAGAAPAYPIFDGRNIWIPNAGDSSLTVVRARDGAVLQTFSAANGNQNGLSQPYQAAFDGSRIAVTNAGTVSISLFKAADLSPIGNIPTLGIGFPYGIVSDGVNFWIGDFSSNTIGRF